MFDDIHGKIPGQPSPQQRLLEPFTELHSVPHFEIAGPADTGHCASIAAQVSRMAPTVEEWLNSAIELTEKGHEHVHQHDSEGAVSLCKMAL